MKMTRKKTKEKAVAAVRTIIQAAKELAEAEAMLCKSPQQEPKQKGKPTKNDIPPDDI